MKKKSIVIAFVALILVFLFILLFKYYRYKQERTIIPTGLLDNEISFGMTIEEVYSIMGVPDSKREEKGFHMGFSNISYYDKVFYGLNSSLVTYRFDGILDDPKAQMDYMILGFVFTDEDECARTVKAIQESLHDAYSKDDRFQESCTEGPQKIEDREDLIYTYRAGSKIRRVAVYQYSSEIVVTVHLSKQSRKSFFEWLFSFGS